MAWARRYVGIPFCDKGRTREEGCDCWGLVRLALLEQQGIALPSYVEAYQTSDDREEVARLIAGQAPLIGHEVTLDGAQPFDILVLRVEGQPFHCGLVVDPPKFLHTQARVNAAIDDYTRPHWRRRILDVVRIAP